RRRVDQRAPLRVASLSGAPQGGGQAPGRRGGDAAARPDAMARVQPPGRPLAQLRGCAASIAREGWPVIGTAAGVLGLVAAVGAAAGHPAAIVPLVVGLGLSLNFFRDPERAPPPGEHLVLSPADGRVVAVVSEREGLLSAAPATRISIFMSPLDVHVNRNPVSGIVERVQHTAGKFRAAFA